jgi:hypothetical protein
MLRISPLLAFMQLRQPFDLSGSRAPRKRSTRVFSLLPPAIPVENPAEIVVANLLRHCMEDKDFVSSRAMPLRHGLNLWNCAISGIL